MEKENGRLTLRTLPHTADKCEGLDRARLDKAMAKCEMDTELDRNGQF